MRDLTYSKKHKRLILQNDLPIVDYDFEGFAEFLSNQLNVRDIKKGLISIEFKWLSTKGNWSRQYIRIPTLYKNAKLTRSSKFAAIYINFVTNKQTDFERHISPFLRGQQPGGKSSMAVLRALATKCACCGLPNHHPLLGKFSIEHKKPVCDGGTNFISNLEVVHQGCNSLLDCYTLEAKQLWKELLRDNLESINRCADYSDNKMRALRTNLLSLCGPLERIWLTAT